MIPDLPNIVPLFPLPNVVFFPKIFLPLHIFEGRYRAMVEDAVQESRVIGMTLLREGWEADYEGSPAIHRTGCAGEIVYVQRLEDGRFNIVLRGMRRFQIRDEFRIKTYRQVRIEPIFGPEQESVLHPLVKTELIEVLRDYARIRSWQRTIEAVLDRNVEDGMLVNLISSELDFSQEEKQFLLESENLDQQTKRLIQLIGFHRQIKKAPRSLGGLQGGFESGEGDTPASI